MIYVNFRHEGFLRLGDEVLSYVHDLGAVTDLSKDPRCFINPFSNTSAWFSYVIADTTLLEDVECSSFVLVFRKLHLDPIQ